MIRVRALASSSCATCMLESHARALFSAVGRSFAATSTSRSTSTTSTSTSFFSTTSTSTTTAGTTPTKLSSTDLVTPEPGLVRIDAYDATSFEITIAGRGSSGAGSGGGGGERGKGRGGRRHRITGAIVLSAPGGFVASWKPDESSSSSSSSSNSSQYYSRIAESLSAIASLVSPRPDIVLVGTGRGGGGGGGGNDRGPSCSSSSPVAAMQRISEAAGGAAVELYPTHQAASLYNVLSQEGRSVLAALLPAGERESRRG